MWPSWFRSSSCTGIADSLVCGVESFCCCAGFHLEAHPLNSPIHNNTMIVTTNADIACLFICIYLCTCQVFTSVSSEAPHGPYQQPGEHDPPDQLYCESYVCHVYIYAAQARPIYGKRRGICEKNFWHAFLVNPCFWLYILCSRTSRFSIVTACSETTV